MNIIESITENCKRFMGNGMRIRILMIGLCIFAPAVHATDYFVDQNNAAANDTNPGSELMPWKTLAKAVKTAQAGDTVHVKAGVYTDPNTGSSGSKRGGFRITNSGTASSPIIFRSEPRGAAVIVSQPSFNSSEPEIRPAAWLIQRNSYITIDGFTVKGMLRVTECSNMKIINNDVSEGATGGDRSLLWGIDIESTTNSLVKNNYVHDLLNNGYLSHNSSGLMVNSYSSDNIIENNTVDVRGSAVWSSYGTKGGHGDRNTWRNNMAIGGITGFYITASSGNTDYPVGDKIHNNVIVNSQFGVAFDHYILEGAQAYNNTAYNVDAFFNATYASVLHAELWNNLSYSKKNGLIEWGGGSHAGYSVTTFDSLLDYSDYNSVSGISANWAKRNAQSSTGTYQTLGSWQTRYGFDTHSNTKSANFVNPGGLDPEDYKRTSYPADGRGGSYASVMGAYVTGNEVIGYRAGGAGATVATAPPDPPTLNP